MTRLFLGLETGGTKAVASVLDAQGVGLATKEVARPASATAPDTLAQLARLGRSLLSEQGLPLSGVAAVGWGFGGHVDRKLNQPAANFHEAGWGSIPAATKLQHEFGAPVFIENDCKVAALAEARLGSGTIEGLNAYITLGSGVGGGLVWNGEILAAGAHGEGEIGHVTVVKNGAPCACGRLGCLEAYCSGWGFGARAMEAIESTRQRTPLMEKIAQAEARQRAALLFAAYPEDAFAKTQTEQFLEHLATACSTLCLLLSPNRLILGGGISHQSWIAPWLEERLDELLPEVMRGSTKVAISKLGNRCVSYGAALYAAARVRKLA